MEKRVIRRGRGSAYDGRERQGLLLGSLWGGLSQLQIRQSRETAGGVSPGSTDKVSRRSTAPGPFLARISRR